MHLEKLNLFNFKNYKETSLEFQADVLCLLGKNGSGKTNLMDAIHYLAFTKSFLNTSDSFNIRTGENTFSIKGYFTNQGARHEVFCSYQVGSKKIVREDGNDYARLSAHIGKYPLVLVAPNDIALIWDGSEVRRKFVDGLISQINGEYLEHLIVYNHQLKMRNAALKHFAERGAVDHDLLEVYSHKLAIAGDSIFRTRQAFMVVLAPALLRSYQFLSQNNSESANVVYKTDLENGSMSDLLRSSLQRDLAVQRTSTGIHRDDFVFQLDAQDIKRYGSQGQQKSFLIGLKLAEFEIIRTQKAFKPLLLLDDIFDKLDDDRISKLIELIASGTFGQIFISDARPDRTKGLLGTTGLKPQILTVANGEIS